VLDRLGVTAVYADSYWDGPRLTFDSAERIIFANPFEDRRPDYLRLVDGADRVAFLFHARVPAFESALQLAGAHFTSDSILLPEAIPYVLYHSFDPRPGGGSEIPVTSVRASHNSDDAGLAVDLDAATRWSTLAPQRRGMWYEIDLGAPKEVGEVLLWPRFAADAPRGLRVEVSSDRTRWETVAEARSYWGPLGWFLGRPVPMLDGWVVARFQPVSCRWLRLTLLASDPKFAWSITELKIRAPEDAAVPAPRPPSPARTRLLTNPVLAGRLPGSVHRSAGRGVPHFADLRDAERIDADDAVLLPTVETPEVGGTAGPLGLHVDHTASLDGYRLLSGFRRDFDAFSRQRLRSWSLDTEKQTARIDLQAVRALAGVAIGHGAATINFPRGIVARTSLDGQSWSDPETLLVRAPELFWSYEGIVGASFRERLFLFSTVRSARFVELQAAPRHPTIPWVVEAISILEPLAASR